MIIRTEIEGRMEKYFRYVFFDRELTLKDKGVLLTLLGLPKDLSFSITELFTAFSSVFSGSGR